MHRDIFCSKKLSSTFRADSKIFSKFSRAEGSLDTLKNVLKFRLANLYSKSDEWYGALRLGQLEATATVLVPKEPLGRLLKYRYRLDEISLMSLHHHLTQKTSNLASPSSSLEGWFSCLGRYRNPPLKTRSSLRQKCLKHRKTFHLHVRTS